MKKIIPLCMLGMLGIAIKTQAQTAAPKLAAYSVNDSVATVQKTQPTAVLAPYAIDSASTGIPTPKPELRAQKKEDPIIAPK